MSAPPNLKYGHPDSEESKAKEAARIAHAKGVERQAWLTLWRTYERCCEIAELVWQSTLNDDMSEQRELAEQMRDRSAAYSLDEGTEPVKLSGLEIPVPLFTPRDRAQFIKEVAATLLISADRQNLHVYFPKEKPEQEPTEAASGVDEEAQQLADAGTQ